jgi:prepilin-type N-terminal cleavage/methylation domain-containing protein
MRATKKRSGLSLLELLVVLGIVGIVAMATYPAIMNALRGRSLEATARQISMDLNEAKVRAVKTRTDMRLLFSQEGGQPWTYVLEQLNADGTWSVPAGYLKKVITPDFEATVNWPDQSVEYSPLGLVQNYTTGQNSITIASPKLRSYGQPDVRDLVVYAGGSVQYIRTSSTEAP